MVNFWIQLPLKETLVATVNKACRLTSRKQVVEKCMNVPVYQKYLHFFRCTTPFLLQKNSLKMLNFQFVLLRKHFLVATLSKPRPLISRRYVAEQGIVTLLRFLMQNNASKMLNFQDFFISKKSIQWLLCVKLVHSFPENMRLNKV